MSSSLKADSRPGKRECFNLNLKAGEDRFLSPEAVRQMKFLLALSVLCRLSTDWVRPTHMREGNLLYSVYSSNVNLIQKQPHRHTRIVFDQMSGWPCVLVKLTINIIIGSDP